MNEALNSHLKEVMNTIEEQIKKEEDLEDKEYDQMADLIPNTEDLSNCLPLMKEKQDYYKEQLSRCDDNIKEWQESKKAWKTYQDRLLTLVGKILTKMNLKSASHDKIKAAITTRKVLEIDNDSILSEFKPMLDLLKNQLPEYVKVTMDIDKTALANYLKTDNSLLINNPEKIHWKDNNSVNLR